MNIRPLSRDEVRSIDALAAGSLGLPTIVLMENAGRGATDHLRDVAGAGLRRVTLLCGPGNNGGDAAVVARHLDAQGIAVDVLYFCHPAKLSGDAALQHGVLVSSGIPTTTRLSTEALLPRLRQSGWLVDGLLGTGLLRPVEGLLREVIQCVNESGRPVLALDLPSGLDCDSGEPLGLAVRASATSTFVAPKRGFSAPEALDYTGKVRVVPIGVPSCLLLPFTTA